MQVDAHPLAKAQFAGRVHDRAMEAREQQRQPGPERVEFLVVAVGVVDLDHGAGGLVMDGASWSAGVG